MYKQEKLYYKRAFFYAMIMAAVLFIPFVILDRGFFVFYGDYNAQQIPFYKTCIEAVRSGNFGWNWQTDLGASLIGSYSFYTLGSPFFWFTAIFPASISQYLMAPLLILKLSLCSLFAFAYIRRFVTNPNYAVIGGLLYAFSGFSMYNVFFNHFHEAIVFFPLLLIGLEELVINHRRGLFAFAVAVSALVNYFFFIGSCVFLVIYFIIRCTSKDFNPKLSTIICIGTESIIGVLIAGILFIPSIFMVLDVPRSAEMLTDWNLVFHNPVQRYGSLLQGIFMPPDIAARQNFFPDSSAKWSSVALYLPLFSMAGVITFIRYQKKHWAKILIPVLFLFALIPVLNSSFVMFNSNYYTRWFYMPTLICCFMTVYALEHTEFDMKYGIKWCLFVTALISCVIFLPKTESQNYVDDNGNVSSYVTTKLAGLVSNPYACIAISLFAFFGIFMCLMLIRKRKRTKSKEVFQKICLGYTAAACLVYGFYTIGYGRGLGPYLGDYNDLVSADFNLEDDSFYRMEVYDEMNNANMLWDMSSLKSFTSILPNSTFELYSTLGITRSVNSDPSSKYYSLRALTATKYLFVSESKNDDDELKEFMEDMQGYEYYDTQSGFEIYKNKNSLSVGVAYDYYVTKDTVNTAPASKRAAMMVKGVLLDEDGFDAVSGFMSELPYERQEILNYDEFEKDCFERNLSAVSSFEITQNGFTASADYGTKKLVVFSVPNDRGWSASVNGEPTEIYTANGGFVSVIVPAGHSELSFTYVTPGIELGIMSTVSGVAAFALYLLFWIVLRKNKADENAHLYFNDQVSEVKAHNSYIQQLYEKIYSVPDRDSKVKNKKSYKLKWPEIQNEILNEKLVYDFRKDKKERTSKITEDDEAYRVLKQLDEEKKRKEEEQ